MISNNKNNSVLPHHRTRSSPKKIYLNKEKDIEEYIKNYDCEEEIKSITTEKEEEEESECTSYKSSSESSSKTSLKSSCDTLNFNLFSLIGILVCFLISSIISILVVNDLSFLKEDSVNMFQSRTIVYLFSGLSLSFIFNFILNKIKLTKIKFIVKSILCLFGLILLFKFFNSGEDYTNSRDLDYSIFFFSLLFGLFSSEWVSNKEYKNMYFIVFFVILSLMSSIYTYYISSYQNFDWCVYLFICLLSVFISSSIYFERCV